jgi:isoleucyl-tRNA synthetase
MSDTDYKDTLNLPQTDFPMKANLSQREPVIQQRWAQQDYYAQILASKNPAKQFLLCDGPPYANGNIHIGHALNKILKSIIVNSKFLSGYYAPFVPGWDCHGLPIELEVEKKVGKAGVKISKSEFRQKCREFAEKQIAIQSASFQRLGVLGNWQAPYKTMNFKFEADIVRTLGQVIENNHLVKGEKPVHWCVLCASALADTEVEYALKKSDSIYVAFALAAQQPAKFIDLINELNLQDLRVLIWTTTPWTLPANQAVALNADFEYSVVEINAQLYLVATELLSQLPTSLAVGKVRTKLPGAQLEGLLLQHPFYLRQVPIILGEHVSLEAGTGCVHTAPAHGYEDFVVGQKYNLKVDNPVDASGCFIASTEFFANIHVYKANEPVIAKLHECNALIAHFVIEHQYPNCWRHKQPLIFRATSQWFISMEKCGLRDKILAQIPDVTWFPSWGENRITKMIQARPDWCISRQRTWGSPLAIFAHKQTGALHPDTPALIEKVALMIEEAGIDAWFNASIEDFLSPQDCQHYDKVSDTLDVWFDSGAVHNCVTRAQADLYLEGSDQHRGWFQVSMISSMATKDQAPFKQVLTHGFTVDANGHKMSKSVGNVIAPEEVLTKFGADILRLWVAATDYSADLHVSDLILTRTADAYRRIRNTARFLLSNLHDFTPNEHVVSNNQMLHLDLWIVAKAQALQAQIIEHYNDYQFHLIYQKIHNFCSQELGSFYLDIIKDRQYTCHTQGIPRRSAQTAMYHILAALVKWIAPILCFTADEIWQTIPGNKAPGVFMEEWYAGFGKISQNWLSSDDLWLPIISVRDEVNKVLESERKNGLIGASLEAEVTLYVDENLMSLLTNIASELRFVLIVSKVNLKLLKQAPATAIKTELEGMVVVANKSANHKCKRCWHYCSDVAPTTEADICGRCKQNVHSSGELREFA